MKYNLRYNKLSKSGLGLFICALLLLFILILTSPKPETPKFIMGQELVKPTNNLIFESFIIPQPDFLLAAHSATLEVLPNGQLIALWFAGSHEGKPDVKIWQSTFNGKNWSVAHAIISPEKIAHDTNSYIRKIGNPVIYRAADNSLYLFVVSVGVGGWSGSSLNQFISKDWGNTWSVGHKLILSPFFNLSVLNRTKAITLADGGFYLPVYYEFIYTYPELLRFDKKGNFIKQERLNSTNTLMQPALLPLSDKHAYVYMRNHTKQDNRLYYQETSDGGNSWSNLLPTNLTNRDSSIAVMRLESTQYLMVHNIGGRDKLALAVSRDGVTWHDVYLLENMANEEFSYPAIQMHNDAIDILYTWKRRNIKHVELNRAWLYSKCSSLEIFKSDKYAK
ncbi:MAG: exo-alpha-sialidase [Burkholderiales bacterium]|nr:exo-alpha-sialidase [Burkholderiales bacterium]